MNGPALVVIGGSAGGMGALKTIARALPAGFPAAVLVAMHAPPPSELVLRCMLREGCALPAAFAADGDPVAPGRIVVAPRDRHLLVEPGRLRLGEDVAEHQFRPAIDPLFRSAALAYGSRVVAVVLSGGNADGTAGLLNVVLRGGEAIVQHPDEARRPAMPRSALVNVPGARCLPASEIGAMLARLAPAAPPARPNWHAVRPSDRAVAVRGWR